MKELEAAIPDLQKEIDTFKNECTNAQKFLDIFRKSSADIGGAANLYQQDCYSKNPNKTKGGQSKLFAYA